MSGAAKVQAIIVDWAGTVIDHGSRAPMGAFVRAFKEFGVDITIADARGPMGMAKWDHIWALGQLPKVQAGWQGAHGRPFGKDDADAIFRVFEPMNVAAVRDHADFIPGALDSLAGLRERGIRIGSTTGYTRPIMEVVLQIAAAAEFAPEIVVCAGDLPAGRPSPLMMWYAMAKLGVWPARTVVKVDDTIAGLGEGTAAGTWTVGLSLSGNMAGYGAEELAALPPAEIAAIRTRAEAEMLGAGADFVIDSVADLPGVIDVIDQRLAAGAHPRAA
jgi:phosphonoacetaldehyde hydrolase